MPADPDEEHPVPPENDPNLIWCNGEWCYIDHDGDDL